MTEEELREAREIAKGIGSQKAEPTPSDSSASSEEGILDYAFNTAEDVALKGLEGLGFGLPKKAMAATEAASKYIASPDEMSLEDVKKIYEEALQKNKERLELAEERTPILGGAAEIAGGFLNPLPATGAKMLGGVLGLGKLAKGASGLIKASEIPETLGAVEKAKRIADLARKAQFAEKAITSVGEGGLIGGGLSAINSEAESVPEFAKDVGLGTLTGLGFGAAIPIGGAAASKAWEGLKKGEGVQKAIRAFQLTKGQKTMLNPEGKPIDLDDVEGQKDVVKMAKKATDTVFKRFKELFDTAKNDQEAFFINHGNEKLNPVDPKISQPLNEVLQGLKDNFKLLDDVIVPSDYLKSALQVARDPLLSGKNLFLGTDISTLSKIRHNILKNSSELKGENIKRVLFGNEQEGIRGLVDKIDDIIMSKHPQYKQLRDNVKMAAKPAEMLLSGVVDQDSITAFLSDLSPEQQDKAVKGVVYRLIRQSGKEGQSGAEAGVAFDAAINQFKESVSHMAAHSPTFAEKEGFKLKDLFTTFKKEMEGMGLDKATAEKLAKEMASRFEASTQGQDALSTMTKTSKFADAGKMLAKELEIAQDEASKGMGVIATNTGIRPGADKEIGGLLTKAVKAGFQPLDWPAVKTGKYLGAAARRVAPVTKTYRDLNRIPVDELKSWAQYLSASKNPKMQNIGRAAVESLNNDPTIGRAVFLNQAMSSPDIREMLGLSLAGQKEEAESSENEEQAEARLKRASELMGK
jgi:hypothetical protein